MDSQALYDAGRQYMDRGALEEAVAAFRQSTDSWPHFKTLELLGECLHRLGRSREAIIPLAAATTLNRQSRAPALLAEVFETLGDATDALAMSRLALERDPHNRRAQDVGHRVATQAAHDAG